jgi:hypothetical protein
LIIDRRTARPQPSKQSRAPTGALLRRVLDHAPSTLQPRSPHRSCAHSTHRLLLTSIPITSPPGQPSDPTANRRTQPEPKAIPAARFASAPLASTVAPRVTLIRLDIVPSSSDGRSVSRRLAECASASQLAGQARPSGRGSRRDRQSHPQTADTCRSARPNAAGHRRSSSTFRDTSGTQTRNGSHREKCPYAGLLHCRRRCRRRDSNPRHADYDSQEKLMRSARTCVFPGISWAGDADECANNRTDLVSGG